MNKIVGQLRKLHLSLPGETTFKTMGLEEEDIEEIAKRLQSTCDASPSRKIAFLKGAMEAKDPCPTDLAEFIRATLLKEYAGTVFEDHTGGDPKIQGPYGEAEIIIKPNAKPVKAKNVSNLG